MKLILSVAFLFVFSAVAFGQTSHVNIFSSVSYNSGTNQVTGYAYTDPAYVNGQYYNTYVNAALRNFAGNTIDSELASGGVFHCGG